MYARLNIPDTGERPFTDYSKWRLKVSDGGRQIWHYLSEEEVASWPQSDIDKYWIGIPLNAPTLAPATDALSAARNGFEYYKKLQTEDGHWAGEYGGPLFLMPGLVIGSYVTGMNFAEAEKLEMIRYLMNHINEDGGLGLHIEGHSTVFGTALNYVALRLLGMDADHPTAVKARGCLHKLGGATGAPAWGKFWLAVLNVYEWSGQNSIPPELFLIPEWLPVHPHRFWIHMRNVFIPMSFIFAKRWKMPKNPLIMSLRQELYTQPYNTIDWPAQCNNVAKVDIYAPHTKLFDMINVVLYQWEKYNRGMPGFVRKKALDKVYDLVVKEDENTAYQTVGPVSKMANQLCRYIVEGRDCESYRMHKAKRLDFMWLGKEGMMMQGTNGSQLWDTSFISQAMVESGLANEPANKKSMLKALDWLDKCQMQENPIHYESGYRHATKGAWPFSTKEQGYTVSDCTAEGLKAVLCLQDHLDYTPTAVDERRLCDAVDVMLSMQNSDGGFASYELIRAPHIIEKLNPAEVFGEIMTEYSYPECTTSVLTALSIFKKHNPTYRQAEIDNVTTLAIEYIHNAQFPEGGWFGSWGICFTYATMFALESLSLVGETYENSARVRRACEFIMSKRHKDGGWGESYKSCVEQKYVHHEKSQVVQTAWAGLALMYAEYPYRQPLDDGIKLIMDRQLPDGSWEQEAIEGIFNKSCAISYPNFKFSFTIWFLGKAHHYLEKLKAQ